MPDSKKCSGCGEVKHLSAFSRKFKTRPELRPDCKQCNKGYSSRNNPRINKVSKLAYEMTGGSSAFYNLPKDKRRKIREAANHVIDLRGDASLLYSVADHEFERTHPDGFVYIVTNPAWPGWFKVGMTTDPPRRLSSYQTGSPHRDYEMVAFQYFEDRAAAEKEIHERLAQHGRQEGEWFQIPEHIAASALAQS